MNCFALAAMVSHVFGGIGGNDAKWQFETPSAQLATPYA
jgi:hypothetical protein